MKINEKLQDELDASKASMKPYFEDNNPEFLQVMQFDNNEYIGKVIENGASLENLTNILMNVKTMLGGYLTTFRKSIQVSPPRGRIFPKPSR